MAMQQQSIQTVRELFAFGLSEMYDCENRILQQLPSLINEINDPDVQAILQHHQQETQQQVGLLQQCFRLLGTQPQPVTCAVLEGFRQEHEAFLRTSPASGILTLFDVNAGTKIESFEITSYRLLIATACQLGLNEIQRLLMDIQRQEEDAGHKLERAGYLLTAKQVQANVPPAGRRRVA
jgi:ferritin-like metal-binding protein YciE